ncbi:hypothetical protein [Leadbettera azotonutricia]|uniref:Putative membrane protein n=1 Tax=Leadbettera azotonutricia (strain ATCC BAA-888 / DSM 13862 / ZAS-9) TaxID=545695 RepID=F5YDR4_LEAAZ|nr:hypothetical protein [Leadbettera azotonutricia]AEF82444.1 putative membrane protein [Leadbettera azotonutricia ZAS-9]
MPKFNKEKVFSPPGIFVIYILAASLAILCFRLIYPGEAAPLAYFSRNWRLLRGALDIITLFPALALSALVIPFGTRIHPQEKLNPFSAKFLQSLQSSIWMAIAAAAIYGLLSFLALPAAKDYENKLNYQGQLYQQAKAQAQEHAVLGEWAEAAQFVSVCEGIWPQGEEIEKLRIESSIRAEEARLAQMKPAETTEKLSAGKKAEGTAVWPNLPDQRPMGVTEALAMAETALKEERYYDAHWLASMAGRLADPENAKTLSAEGIIAARLASQAWNAVTSLEPNSRESEEYKIYRLKQSGYKALESKDWIRAYYIFLELLALTPADPDAEKYFGMAEEGTTTVAFFIDEMDLAMGEALTGAIFSLPLGMGRVVIRVSSLSTFSDSAYGIGAEILAFDRDGRPDWRMDAPYVKILPFTLDTGPRVTLLARALDRTDGTKRWEPAKEGLGENPPDGAALTLNLSWDDFLLLSDIRRGTENLPVNELLEASRITGNFGYIPQVFEAELIRRFAQPIFFLPFAVLILVIGWRYRALKRPRYLAVPMMAILPLVFNGAVHFFGGFLNNAGIWAVINLGLTGAIAGFAIGAFVLLILSLIILAAQHG